MVGDGPGAEAAEGKRVVIAREVDVAELSVDGGEGAAALVPHAPGGGPGVDRDSVQGNADQLKTRRVWSGNVPRAVLPNRGRNIKVKSFQWILD